jgi:hypothetical protein
VRLAREEWFEPSLAVVAHALALLLRRVLQRVAQRLGLDADQPERGADLVGDPGGERQHRRRAVLAGEYLLAGAPLLGELERCSSGCRRTRRSCGSSRRTARRSGGLVAPLLNRAAIKADYRSANVEVAKVLYQSAHVDYYEVLMTQRDSLEAEMDLVEVKRDQMQAVVSLYQALGGGWRRPAPG